MIKRIGLTYEEERYKVLRKKKDASGKSWEDFFFDLAKGVNENVLSKNE